MNKLLVILILAFAPVALTSCSSAPNERVAVVQTLKAVGHTAETALGTAGALYKSGQITEAQLRQVAELYDTSFQPAFRLAVAAAQSDYTLQAPDQLIALSSQLAALVVSFQSR